MRDVDAQARLAELARSWRVRIQRVELTRTSLLAFGVTGQQRVVLKVLQAPGDEWNSGGVAAAFGGHGVVRVHAHVPGAVLLEELRPGTSLAEIAAAGRDDDATTILADVVTAMSYAAPPTNGSPAAEDWAAGFHQYRSSGDAQLAAGLVEEALHRYIALCRTQHAVRLLHGDLQHYNVLEDTERGWVAIDPKGVVAETEFELAAALRNPRKPAALHTAAAIERRVERLQDALRVDAERLLGWTFAQAVLSAIWTVQDDGSVDPRAPAMRVAHAAHSLLT